MVARLHESNPRQVPCPHPLQHVLHQLAADHAILCGGIDGDRSSAGNRRALVHKIAAHDPPVALCNHAIKAGVGEQTRQQPDSDVWRGKISWKVVLFRDGFERFIADRAAELGLFRPRRSQCDGHSSSPSEVLGKFSPKNAASIPSDGYRTRQIWSYIIHCSRSSETG
jgi:hypothetical protein